jgi:hypothetical protein
MLIHLELISKGILISKELLPTDICSGQNPSDCSIEFRWHSLNGREMFQRSLEVGQVVASEDGWGSGESHPGREITILKFCSGVTDIYNTTSSFDRTQTLEVVDYELNLCMDGLLIRMLGQVVKPSQGSTEGLGPYKSFTQKYWIFIMCQLPC